MRASCAIAGGLVVASTMGVPDLSEAADLTITKTVTEPVRTSNASGGPGNILIESNGGVVVDKGTAVFIDSSHKVDNKGRVESKGIDGRGIVITGSVTSTVTNKGTITLGIDSDDKTVDGGNIGILLDTGASMTGDILNDTSGTISVSGTSPTTATNAAAIEFAAASGGNWGSIGWAAIFDASTSGNMLAWAALSTARTINDGDVLRIPAGDLDVTLT